MLAPWKKSYDQPRQHIEKQRHYFPNKGPSSQTCFSSGHVWMWELDYKESWAPKKWWFWRWCWRRLLRVPWTARRSNQSILKEISPGCSLEGLMLTHWKRPWCWDRLRAGGAGDDRGWDGWMASSTQRTWVCINSGSWWWTGRPGMLRSMGSQRVGHNWVTELNWSWTHWYVCATGRNENVSCFVESSSLWPVDCSPPGSSVHGISQARILEWVAIFFSRESSSFRNWTQFSHTAGRSFTVSATREGPKIEEKVLISTINN